MSNLLLCVRWICTWKWNSLVASSVPLWFFNFSTNIWCFAEKVKLKIDFLLNGAGNEMSLSGGRDGHHQVLQDRWLLAGSSAFSWGGSRCWCPWGHRCRSRPLFYRACLLSCGYWGILLLRSKFLQCTRFLHSYTELYRLFPCAELVYKKGNGL